MSKVVLVPWSEGDLPLLHSLLGDPEMMEHLGGPETPEQISKRHERFLREQESGKSYMFRISLGPDADAVGSIGFWETTWQNEQVYETGWFILPAFQGRGIATEAAKAIIALARADHKYSSLHAFPPPENGASNAICRKAGFKLLGEYDSEYPKGRPIRVNDWAFELFSE